MSSIVSYRGTCDASAAVRLGSSSMFVSASDEDFILRVYDREAPGLPSVTADLEAFLKPSDPGKEPDIEGAAAVGNRIYWVTSHGRDKNRRRTEEPAAILCDVGDGNGTQRTHRACRAPLQTPPARPAGHAGAQRLRFGPRCHAGTRGARRVEHGGSCANARGLRPSGFSQPDPRGTRARHRACATLRNWWTTARHPPSCRSPAGSISVAAASAPSSSYRRLGST